MGQIIGSAAKPKRCNLNRLSQFGIPAAGEYILVSSDNSMNAAGQGDFDAYVVGDGKKAATGLELKQISLADKLLQPYVQEFANQEFSSQLNGTSSVGVFSRFELSGDGNELEVELWPDAMSGNQVFSLFQQASIYNTRVTGTRTVINVRASDDTWIFSNLSIGNLEHYVLKIAYENGNINAYVDGVLKGSYTGQKTICIDRCGRYNSSYWSGKVGYIKVNGVRYNTLNELPEWSGTDVVINSPSLFLTPEERESLVNSEFAYEVATELSPFVPEFKKLGFQAVFNGASSVATCTAFTLSSNGDIFEIELWPGEMSGNQRFSLATETLVNRTRIGATRTEINIRANDDTWICLYESLPSTLEHYVLKIEYKNGNIYTYIDGELLKTYEGQKAITIAGFGQYNTSFWSGKIGFVKVNGISYDDITKVPGWTPTNVDVVMANGFLTSEQGKALDASSYYYPRMVASFAPNGGTNSVGLFTIWQRYKETNIYFRLQLTHLVDDTDANYLNLWRIETNGGVDILENGGFTPIGKSLLVGAENEFTFAYSGASDFTGGYHGDERIDSEGCYAKFFINGVPFTNLANSFDKVVINSFYMLQRATLHETTPSGGSPVAGHPVIAYHTKKTEFLDCGFECTNRVDFDFTNSNLDSVTTTSLFTGLVCVSKDCASNAYVDDFIIRSQTGSNEQIEITDAVTGKACFYSELLSCDVNSDTFTENDENLRMLIWDRSGDTKYYRYAANRTFTTGDKYMSHTKASWSYKK